MCQVHFYFRGKIYFKRVFYFHIATTLPVLMAPPQATTPRAAVAATATPFTPATTTT